MADLPTGRPATSATLRPGVETERSGVAEQNGNRWADGLWTMLLVGLWILVVVGVVWVLMLAFFD